MNDLEKPKEKIADIVDTEQRSKSKAENDPSILMKTKIQGMQHELTSLKAGDERFDSLKTNYTEKNKLNQERLDIKTKGESLFEKAKTAMRKAALVGIATMAISGSTDMNNSKKPGDTPKTTKQTEMGYINQELSAIKQVDRWLKIAKNEKERQALIEYKKALEQSIETEKKALARAAREKLMADPKYRAEMIRTEIKNIVGSQAYLDKLKLEFGDIKRAKAEQTKRLNYLKNFTIKYIDPAKMEQAWFSETLYDLGVPIPKWLVETKKYFNHIKSVGGYYDVLSNKVVIPEMVDDRIMRHEILHASVDGRDLLPRTKKELKKSYKPLKDREDKYYGDPDEIYARKGQVEYEMIKFGILKPGEKFTEDKYHSLIRLYAEKKLSQDAMDFIKRIKLKNLPKIFNEIAQQDGQQGLDRNIVS